MTSLTAVDTSDPAVARFAFTGIRYDGIGNLLSASVSMPPAAGFDGMIRIDDLSGTLALSYDSLFNPTEEKRTTASGTLYDHFWTTNAAGDVTNSLGVALTPDADHRISGSGYAWDGEGNPTSYMGQTMSWDEENSPTGITGILSEAFRADGVRASKTTAAGKQTYFVYDGDQVVCEIAGANSSAPAGSVFAAYVYGPNGLEERYEGGSLEFYGWDLFSNLVERYQQTINGANQTDPLSEAVFDSKGSLVFDLSTNTGQPLAPIDPVAGHGKTDWTDEELRGMGDLSGIQLVQGRGYFDPTNSRTVNRWGQIQNEYQAEILPWQVSSGIARGFSNSYFSAAADAVDAGSFLVRKGSFGLINPPPVPSSWREPGGHDRSKIGKASEGIGFALFGGTQILQMGRGVGDARRLTDHHFATNKNLEFTPEFEKITSKFGLKLDEQWNRELLPFNVGRHPKEYHKFVIDRMEEAARLSGGDREVFLDHFDRLVKQPIRAEPLRLRKRFYKG